MSTPNIPNILYIKGVFKKDCLSMTQIIETKYGDTEQKAPVESTYDRIPSQYKPGIWPEYVNAKCWNCGGDCSEVKNTISIPTTFEKEDDGTLCIPVEGIYDTWACGAARIKTHYKNNNLIKLMYVRFYNIINKTNRQVEILPAIDAQTHIKEFGLGTLTRGEYHKLNDINDRKFMTLLTNKK